jgi:hypothetical protein
MSGNKGAVGVRLDYHDTSFCFLTAHLAAGHANVEERNADYRTIVNGLQFLKGKTVTGHEWDFTPQQFYSLLTVSQKYNLARRHQLPY